MNTEAQTNDDDARQWLTTSQAAAALGVAPKTIRRRIERGELEARKMPRDGGGVSWRVQIGDERDSSEDISRDSSTPTKGTTQHPRNAHAERVKDSSTPSERDSSEDMGAERKGQLNAHEEDSDRVSDLRDEVKFLRGVIEQLQRDGAEVRAALREALKHRAPQLTQGNAPEPQETPQTGAATKDGHADQRGPQQPAERKGATDWNSIYGQIADELEAQEKNR